MMCRVKRQFSTNMGARTVWQTSVQKQVRRHIGEMAHAQKFNGC